jgi:hypothetical protein
VIADHEVVDGGKIAAEMLTTLKDLETERILKEFGAFGAFVGNLSDSRVGDNSQGASNGIVVLISDRRDWII